MIEQKDFLVVGDMSDGYIVVPSNADLMEELESRCVMTGICPSDSVRVLRLPVTIPIDYSGVFKMEKQYHELTEAERTAVRIAKNREIERSSRSNPRWTVGEIAARLNSRRQRASYGAVAAVAGGLARGVMNGRAKSQLYSWIVAATGSGRGLPTGYTTMQIHPDCLRQIEEGGDDIINDGEELRRWLEESSSK